MKTLRTIQTLSKIGKILSRIAFILSLVSACICAVGLICLPLGGGELLKIGGVTLYGLMGVSEAEGVRLAAAALSGWLVVCACEAVLAKFAVRCFANELAAGTPFTRAGARELKRLGILTIALPLGGAIVAEIVQEIIAAVLRVTVEQTAISFDPDGSIVLGIMFLVASLLCRYGAELARGADGSGGEASQALPGGDGREEAL